MPTTITGMAGAGTGAAAGLTKTAAGAAAMTGDGAAAGEEAGDAAGAGAGAPKAVKPWSWWDSCSLERRRPPSAMTMLQKRTRIPLH